MRFRTVTFGCSSAEDLVGRADGEHAWGHEPGSTPLHGWLAERGLLDPARPPLRP